MSWLGHDATALARVLALPQVSTHAQLTSTMDFAHALATQGAPAGSLVLAEEQTAGRGRAGRAWSSTWGAGIWMTLLERPRVGTGLDVLSLRIGLRLAPVLERWSDGPIQLKWPNDLYVRQRKLAGILVEARWRGPQPEWVAIGLGINLLPPSDRADAASLGGATPLEVLAESVPAVRAAAFATGPLTDAELAEFATRDFAVGRRVSQPAEGTVRGVSPTGELLVETPDGVAAFRAGSLVLAST